MFSFVTFQDDDDDGFDMEKAIKETYKKDKASGAAERAMLEGIFMMEAAIKKREEDDDEKKELVEIKICGEMMVNCKPCNQIFMKHEACPKCGVKWEEEKPMINRVALHSSQIAFKDLKGHVIEAEADYPKDFSVLIKLLRKFN